MSLSLSLYCWGHVSPHLLDKNVSRITSLSVFVFVFLLARSSRCWSNLEFLSECVFCFVMSGSVTGMGGIELPQTLHWLSFALAERNSKVVEDKFNDSSKGVDGKRPVVILLCWQSSNLRTNNCHPENFPLIIEQTMISIEFFKMSNLVSPKHVSNLFRCNIVTFLRGSISRWFSWKIRIFS